MLSIAPTALTTSDVFLPTVLGFSSGDKIIYQGVANNLSFQGTSTGSNGQFNAGILTLLNGTLPVAILDLTLPSGEYFTGTFSISNNGSTSTVTVAPGGDAPPSIVAPSTISYNNGITVPVPNVAVYDATVVPTMTVNITDTSGILLANTSASGGGGTIAGSGSKAITITGLLSEVDADLTTLAYQNSTTGGDSIIVSANNGLGGTSSKTIGVTYDPSYPIVSITSAGGLTNNPIQTLTGTVNLANAGTTVKILDGSTQIASVKSAADGTWSVPVTLSGDGLHVLMASDTDAAGSTGTATVTYTLEALPPAVTAISASPSSGDQNTGHVITFTMTLSQPVNVTGTPVLNLNDGGAASYVSGSGSNALTFGYTVANGENAANLAVIGNTLNGSTINIANAFNNPANLSGADVSFAGLSVGATVKSITANPATGDLGPGKKVVFTVTTSEPVTITGGTPFLLLNDGGKATYTSGSGKNVLTFTYTVGATGSGQNVSALAVASFQANGATIYDSGNVADTADLSGVTAFTSGPQIDTMAPIVTSVVAIPATADLNAGKVVTLTAIFSEAVTVVPGTSGSRLTFESLRGFPAELNACESGACEPEFPSLSSLRIAAA